MKKILLMTLAAAMGAAFAEEAKTVTLVSQNTVGIMPVARTQNEVTVSVPFVNVGDGDDLVLANALYTGNLNMGTGVGICINSPFGYFDNWLAYGELASMVNKDFEVNPQLVDGVTKTPKDATLQTVPRGVAIELSNVRANKVYVMGQYTSDRPTTTIKMGMRSYLANPTSEPVNLAEKLSAEEVDWFDLIQIPVKTSAGVKYLEYQFDGSRWYYATYNNVIQNGVIKRVPTITYEDPIVAPNTGFYYWRSDFAFTDLVIHW